MELGVRVRAEEAGHATFVGCGSSAQRCHATRGFPCTLVPESEIMRAVVLVWSSCVVVLAWSVGVRGGA